MEVVRRSRRLPPPKLFCALCRGRYEITLFHEGLGPAPVWWEKSGAVFLKPPKPPKGPHAPRSPKPHLRRR